MHTVPRDSSGRERRVRRWVRERRETEDGTLSTLRPRWTAWQGSFPPQEKQLLRTYLGEWVQI